MIKSSSRSMLSLWETVGRVERQRNSTSSGKSPEILKPTLKLKVEAILVPVSTYH